MLFEDNLFNSELQFGIENLDGGRQNGCMGLTQLAVAVIPPAEHPLLNAYKNGAAIHSFYQLYLFF